LAAQTSAALVFAEASVRSPQSIDLGINDLHPLQHQAPLVSTYADDFFGVTANNVA